MSDGAIQQDSVAGYVFFATGATFVASGFLYVIASVLDVPLAAISADSLLARTASSVLGYLQQNYGEYLPIIGAVPAVLQQKGTEHLLPLCEVILFLGLSLIAISSIVFTVVQLAGTASEYLAAERTERRPALAGLRSAAAWTAVAAFLAVVLELMQSNASNALFRNFGSDGHQPGVALMVWLGGFYLVLTIFIGVALGALRAVALLILPARKS